MALDFPANPSDGEVFGSYVWSGSKSVWQSREESAAPAVVSPVPPTSPNTGDIWVDSSDGVSYVYYDDGSSGQWIEMISSGVPQLASKANLAGGNTFTGTQTFNTPIAITSGGTGTTTGTLSDVSYNKIVNPAGGGYNTTVNIHTGAIRVILPVGWSSHMHKFNVSVFDYNTGKSFDVVIAGYNWAGGSVWVNPSAYVTGNQLNNLNYTVRFGYTAGGRACVYIGETNSTWNYPQVAINNVLVGFSTSSSAWLSGWTVDFVTAFESVTQTVTNTQIASGLISIVPLSTSVVSGSASIAANGTVTFSGVSAITIKNVFSGSFNHYRYILTITSASNDADIMMQLGKTGLSNLGSGYTWGRVAVFSGPSSNSSYTANTNGNMFGRISAGGGMVSGDIINPGNTSRKAWNSISADQDFFIFFGGRNSSSTAYEDVYLYLLQGGTFSGTMQVFGYR
jgi:hypothetical protein